MGLRRKELFTVTWRDALVSLGILLCAGLVCALLRLVFQDGEYVSMLFILAVLMIARFTGGYLCGILSSLLAVLAVNFIFTFPYFRFNFTLAGYPLTILCMLAVSITTSALTSQAKENEAIRIEAEKEKTRGNLLRAVSHDLRTPLTTISGAVSAILENGDALTAGERTELLTGAQSDAQWLIRMVENLLTVTRMGEDGDGGLVKTPEAVEDILAGAIRKFQKTYPHIAVTVDMPENCLLVPVDPVLIEQVLFNLLENAATHGRTVDRIGVTVGETGGQALFLVRDNGVGIDPAKLPHLFDGYLLGTNETGGDSKRNMGIGLSVCNTIIRAHGGTLRAYNEPTGGAAFEFLLNL